MPCTPRRARRLLHQHKAAVFRRYPFTIILKDRSKGDVQPMDLKIDPGSRNTGIALVSHNKNNRVCVFGMTLVHRGLQIKILMQERKLHRRSRRGRKTRYRQPRFNNRIRSKGWLAPSVQHLVQGTCTWISRLSRYTPVTRIPVEYVSFNINDLLSPEQKKTLDLKNKMNNVRLREFLLDYHDRTCQYCDGMSLATGSSGAKYLEIEHIVPRSKGGSNDLSNTTLACSPCNRQKGNKLLEDWIVELSTNKDQLSIARVKGIQKVMKHTSYSVRDATIVNLTRDHILEYAKSTGVTTISSPGWITKFNRLSGKYRKDHWIDASQVYESSIVDCQMSTLIVKSTKTRNRRMVNNDRFGFPLKDRMGNDRKSKGPSRIHGFRTGDMAIVKDTHLVRVTIRVRGEFKGISPVYKISTSHRHFRKIHSRDGYSYLYSGVSVD